MRGIDYPPKIQNQMMRILKIGIAFQQGVIATSHFVVVVEEGNRACRMQITIRSMAFAVKLASAEKSPNKYASMNKFKGMR
jgi:hypothetical protein